MNSNKTKQMKIIINTLYIILLDQFSKIIVLYTLGFNSSNDLITGLLRIKLVKNTGAAFSLFSDATESLTIISILASLLLIIVLFRFPPKSYWNLLGIVFLLGGTLGNGIDRVFRGYVLDFIELIPINFPIFNVADISINIALLCFTIDLIKTNKNYTTINKN